MSTLRIYTHINTQVYTHVHTHMCIHTYVHTHTHADAHACTHTGNAVTCRQTCKSFRMTVHVDLAVFHVSDSVGSVVVMLPRTTYTASSATHVPQRCGPSSNQLYAVECFTQVIHTDTQTYVCTYATFVYAGWKGVLAL